MIKDWKLPEKFILISDAFKIMAIVKLDEVRKYYEDMGYVYKEKRGYTDQEIVGERCAFIFDVVNEARMVANSLSFDCGDILLPNDVGLALLPFGRIKDGYAVAIAPRIIAEDD